MTHRIAIILCSLSTLHAAERVDYETQIKPVLKSRCYACHGALKQKARLRLDTAKLILKGGRHGSAVSIQAPEKSLLLERVSAKDEDERMPPEGQPLTSEEITLIQNWIRQGAKAPDDEQAEVAPQDHWAFQPPQRAMIPTAPKWARNPIDAFLAQKQQGITPLPSVEKGLLLRRAYLDLVGLPPTRQQIHSFLADPRPDAFERVVDSLLASPAYGERWGRHWMDIWRYSDWYGLGKQLRYSQKHIWHWRDWIIESLNADKGYDQMILEMLAADELYPTDREKLRASGFLARSYFLFNRTTWLDNTIEHTAKAFLGLTVNCAKCHDHKYDPITQRDYYRYRAIFEPHQVRLDPVPGVTDLEKNGLPRVFDAHPDAKTYLHIRGNDKDLDKSSPIEPGIPEIFTFAKWKPTQIRLPLSAHDPSTLDFVINDRIALARQKLRQAEQLIASLSKPRSAPSKGKLLFSTTFDKESDDLETGPGKWTYRNGSLHQSQTGFQRAYLRSRSTLPRDFEATLRFKTVGGDKWKSVGLAFDVANDREKLVYLSAVKPGSKLQISYKVGDKQTYPPKAAQARSVPINTIIELTIKVRDTLVNVSVDGLHALAYRLPIKRESGHLEVVAFDAAVEFDSLEVRELGSQSLVQPGGKATNKPLNAEEAKLALQIASKSVEAQQLRIAFLESLRTASESKATASRAALAEAKWKLADAEAQILQATQKLRRAKGKAKAQAQKELQTAIRNRDQAKKKLANPGTTYTRIQASLKALEGPAETAASRNKPYPKVSTGRRSALAKWIVDRRNPLTARVAVNHLWLRHFGQPLVESVTDFGRRATVPKHQALLDWLAVELMSKRWSMKHIHRLMVTSQTYRLSGQTSLADAKTRKLDPTNSLYWHRKPMRMEAELVRDSLISLAGLLTHQQGGPTVSPKTTNSPRRSLYFTRSRDDVHKFLDMFDQANIRACYRRTESVVPQQALTLVNSRLALSMARMLAGRIQIQDDEAFVEAAFETILCRKPNDEEKSLCLKALKQMQKLLTLRRHANPVNRARENVVHALLNHNDFLTIR